MTLNDHRTIVIKSQPSERVYALLRRFGFDARPIQIFDAEQELHAALPGEGPGEEKRAGIAQMQGASGARGQA